MRVVRVLLVVEVQQLDRAAGVGERERDPVGDPHLVPTSGSMSAAFTVGYLRACATHVTAERQRRLPQPLLAERAAR